LDLFPVVDDKVKDGLAQLVVGDRDRTEELVGGAVDRETGSERVERHLLQLVALEEVGEAIDRLWRHRER
ncbi:hypothetical protein B8W95_14125, partial [Staphylococcus pasteuri]